VRKFIKVSLIITVLFISVFSIYGIYDPSQENSNQDEYNILSDENTTVEENVNPIEYKAKITQNISIDKSEEDGYKYQKVKVKIISDSEYKDQEYDAKFILQVLDSSESKVLNVGTTVYVILDNPLSTTKQFIVKDVDRMPYLTIVLIIFIATIILIGKKQGVKTVISLAITFFAVFYMLVPLILNGHDAILMSVLICIFISVTSLTLVGGFNRKSLVSIIGTVSGVLISAIIAIIISSLARITGLSNEDAQMLIYVSSGTSIDVYGLFFASIIIGTVGATMDIAMSISSTMNELTKTSNKISTKELIKSGLNVGKDSMGTMSNTLILAYVGESLILIILFMLNDSNWVSIVNSDFIASEILRGLCGTIGMIATIPVTTYLYGLIHNFYQNKNKIM